MQLNTDSFEVKNYELTPEGFLKFWMVGGIPDKVLEYDNGHKEVINKDSLFDPKSINSAVGKPICLNHPPSAITSKNYKQLSHGVTLQEYAEDSESGALVLAGIIHDSDVVEGILKGNYKYISAGYAADKTPNEDGVMLQSNRNYNHFAVLTEEYAPRAGNDSKILVINDKPQLIEDSKTDAPTREPSTIDANSVNSNDSSGNVPIEPNTDSSREKMINDIAERVELLTTWKSKLEANNKTIDYQMDAVQIKREILSLYYPEKTMKMVKDDNLDGFWLGFLANGNSVDAGGEDEPTPASTYRKPAQVSNYDSALETELQKFIKLMGA